MKLGGRSMESWVEEYAGSHQHPINRLCHTVGIPLIVLSLPLFAAAIFVRGLWPIPLGLFVVGWIFQFIGHYVYEKRSPAFFRNLAHLLVGPLWIVAKAVGRT